jgi:hypothetical protein
MTVETPMSDTSKVAENIRALAEQAGLGKAFKLAPEIVATCVERGQHPLTQPAASPLTTPAPVFDPASFELKR